MEQVILAFREEKNSRRIRELLEGGGVCECLLCRSAAEVRRLTARQGVAGVVCGYRLSDDTAEGLFADLPRTCGMLVLAPQDMLELMTEARIWKLAAPAGRSELLSAVAELLEHGARDLRPARTGEEQAAIARAKAQLMGRGMTEEQAHRWLQRRSMEAGARLADIAQMLLDGRL